MEQCDQGGKTDQQQRKAERLADRGVQHRAGPDQHRAQRHRVEALVMVLGYDPVGDDPRYHHEQEDHLERDEPWTVEDAEHRLEQVADREVRWADPEEAGNSRPRLEKSVTNPVDRSEDREQQKPDDEVDAQEAAQKRCGVVCGVADAAGSEVVAVLSQPGHCR